jgi:cell division ATPase FtsA
MVLQEVIYFSTSSSNSTIVIPSVNYNIAFIDAGTGSTSIIYTVMHLF